MRILTNALIRIYVGGLTGLLVGFLFPTMTTTSIICALLAGALSVFVVDPFLK